MPDSYNPMQPFQSQQKKELAPRTVQGARLVSLALVTFTDPSNVQHTTLAVVGQQQVHLLEGRELGLSNHTTPKGPANKWLVDAIKAKLAENEPVRQIAADYAAPAPKKKGKK